MNLVSNGLEAMDAGGTMTIDIAEQTDQVTLIVTDDGCGMTPQVIENLFEPFFTQRRDGRGTGLGLSISHRIVGDHGGTIDVDSPGPGRGSTFRVRLPRRAVKRKWPLSARHSAARIFHASPRDHSMASAARYAFPRRPASLRSKMCFRIQLRHFSQSVITPRPTSLMPNGFGVGAPRRGLLEHIARE